MSITDRRLNYKALVIGRGEVGQALSNIFLCEAIDLGERAVCDQYEFLHIAFPWSEDFESEVQRYQEIFNPLYTIIHSTVPVGTSLRLGAIHSPIRGMAPNIEQGIRTFTKFLGGKDAYQVAEYFRDMGLRIILCDKSETTELGMLLGTECYRINIDFAKYAKEKCDQHWVNYNEAYTLFAKEYNDGWIKLGQPEYVRQVLQPIMKPIGGHCLMMNKDLINK